MLKRLPFLGVLTIAVMFARASFGQTNTVDAGTTNQPSTNTVREARPKENAMELVVQLGVQRDLKDKVKEIWDEQTQGKTLANDKSWDGFYEIIAKDLSQYEESIAAVYSHELTDDEILQFRDFLKTSAGKKLFSDSDIMDHKMDTAAKHTLEKIQATLETYLGEAKEAK